MKKLLIALLICCCVSPLYAQRGRKFFSWEKPATFSRVQAVLARTREKIIPTPVSHIQITNLPDKPLVKLGGTTKNTPAVLSARILSGDENYKHLYSREGWFPPVYVPEALNTAEESVFRGLKLYNLASIQNILTNGLEYDRVATGMEDKIYFSGGVYRAAGYITWHNSKYSPYNVIPTLVRLALPADRSDIYAHSTLWAFDYYYQVRNIPASYIQDVMVFLEVDGKPDWYKVTLEDGELIFTPAPSRVFEPAELIEHNINIPETNIDFSRE